MPYTVTSTDLPGVLILEPKVFGDERGFFFESFNAHAFEAATGLKRNFVQDNHSKSAKGVLRGLHYQSTHPQGKIVRAIKGEVLDVAVDIRKHSPTFGKWIKVILSEENRRQLWIPEGFAHGVQTLSETSEFLYKTTDYYSPEDERCIRWNDPELAITWHCTKSPILSAKDAAGASLAALRRG